MDAAYYWQKAATCLRLAQTLSLDNPGRLSLIEMAVGFERRANAEAAKTIASRTGSDDPSSHRHAKGRPH
jgi:hypothetical protein